MKKTFLTVLLTCGLLLSAANTEAAELRLDGIVDGLAGAEGGWTAVINGETVAPGQEIAGYRLLEVAPDSVQVQKLEGGEILRLAVGQKLGEEEAVPVPAENETPAAPGWFESFVRRHFPQLVQLSENARYAAVVKDIRVIYHAAVIEYMNSPNPDHAAPSVAGLAAAGKIPRFFQNSVSDGYRYRIQNADYKLRVYADPVEPGADKKHFLMDEHGYLYAEDGRQATTASARFQSGFRLQVMPDR